MPTFSWSWMTKQKKLCVINTPFGLFQYNRMCFGVASSSTALRAKVLHLLHKGHWGATRMKQMVRQCVVAKC